MDLITIDFESYYDKQYSLSKITTEQYIRSPDFEAIGVGVKVNDGETRWITGTHEQLKRILHRDYDFENAAVLAHNTMFDGAILSWVFDIHPRVLFDTLCMARAIHGVDAGGSLAKLAVRYRLGEKGTEVVDALGKRRADFSYEELKRYGQYCINDVELTYKLFNKMVPVFPKKELKIIDMTLRMFTEPTLVLDAPKLKAHLQETQGGKQRILDECGLDKKSLMSNNKFAEALRSFGVEPPMKISPTTGKETYAFAKTDPGLKELADHDDPDVQALVAARTKLKSTLEETRTERFLDIASRGKLPVPIKYYAAHTGRWGGQDAVNLQNLPSRGDNAKVLKSCIKAPEGYTIVEADSAQIEARVLAWLAEQNDLVRAFENGEDVYVKMASQIYDVPEENVDKHQRFIGKSAILGCGYGLGHKRFREQLASFGVDIAEHEAKRIIEIYRETNGEITQFWRDAQTTLHSMVNGETYQLGRKGVLSVIPRHNAIQLPSGLFIFYPKLKMEEGEKGLQFSYYQARMKSWSYIYGGKFTENVSQGIARCVMGEQMLLISKRYPIALTVHDSVVCCVPNAGVAEAADYINKCMGWAPEWASGLPVRGDVEIGPNYGECIEWEKWKESQRGHSAA